MGYMGFGLRKEEYTRKPKEAFEKEKKLYGDHLEKYPKIIQQKSINLYLQQLEDFKNKRRLRTKISESFLGMIMTLSIVFIIYILFVWVSG